jgi:hypothetical protein
VVHSFFKNQIVFVLFPHIRRKKNFISCFGWRRCFVDYAEPSSVYDNNIYHEECLRCNACGVNLTGPSQKRARRFKNQIFCDLHFADVALMESSDFMQQLRSFKPQSLGCAVARRKSSTTLIFPLPPQACSGILHIGGLLHPARILSPYLFFGFRPLITRNEPPSPATRRVLN